MNADSKVFAAKRKGSVSAKSRPTPLDALNAENLVTLRLSDADTSEFEHLRHQVKLSRDDLGLLAAEDASVLDDTRYDLLAAAQKRMVTDTTAMVHFLAPRVMKLRDGEAKRKWRSFVTKLQKDSRAA